MGIFSGFEDRVSSAFEKLAGMIIPAHLQEQEVLDALREEMSKHLTVENGRQVAPYRWLVKITPADLKRLREHTPALGEQLALNLKYIANEQDYLLPGALAVTFKEIDPKDPSVTDPDARRVGPGRIVCKPLASNAFAPQPAAGAQNTEATTTLDASAMPVPLPPPPNVQMPPAWLTLWRPSRGEPMLLKHQTTRIGRHNTNDIIVNERRVSRYHAEVKYENGQFMLYDLHSINGVLVNGAPIRRPIPLQDHDIVSVCGYEFMFQRRAN